MTEPRWVARGPAFRRELRALLAETLPPEWPGIGALREPELSQFLDRWRKTLLPLGLLAPTWPAEFGGAGLGPAEELELEEEFLVAGVPRYPWPSDPFAFALLGPTMLAWATPEQKAYFLSRMISGEHRWAQGYSEPDAGSDLFSLRTRAHLDGDEWVVTGQKVWQTQGQKANWIFVLARTEPDAPNSSALSLLLVPVDQPGVTVRGIRTMTGEEEFSEVFLDEARTAAEHVVGPRGAGSKVAMTLLGFERNAAAGASHLAYRMDLDRIVTLACERGRETDPQIRQELAWCRERMEMMRILALTAREGIATGASPGAESSMFKLYESEFNTRLTALAIDVLGVESLVTSGPGSSAILGNDPRGVANSTAAWQAAYLRARAATIYGGTSQIQRNTLGERILGLPREPRATIPEVTS
jgi:alkylation response protein AidB-like acyl-CoA dehydrogenase